LSEFEVTKFDPGFTERLVTAAEPIAKRGRRLPVLG
jgi:hypothetical protein